MKRIIEYFLGHLESESAAECVAETVEAREFWSSDVVLEHSEVHGLGVFVLGEFEFLELWLFEGLLMLICWLLGDVVLLEFTE